MLLLVCLRNWGGGGGGVWDRVWFRFRFQAVGARREGVNLAKKAAVTACSVCTDGRKEVTFNVSARKGGRGGRL